MSHGSGKNNLPLSRERRNRASSNHLSASSTRFAKNAPRVATHISPASRTRWLRRIAVRSWLCPTVVGIE